MYCNQCGNDSGIHPLCESCAVGNTPGAEENGRIGYSRRITDPAFSKYIKASNTWSALFALILAVIAVTGFIIYGETSYEMDNPEALYIGLVISGMFVSIALFQIISRKRSRTWDGVVTDKRIEKKVRKKYTSGDSYYFENYVQYIVFITDRRGKVCRLIADNDDTVYSYYRIGDHVRHHGGLNSYEKYDKTRDTIVFCAACRSLNQITDDKCFRCGCPLLK